jgi:uncharacterized protein DUF6585
MSARPYREIPPIEPDPAPQRASEAERIGSLRSVHAPPPLHRALVGPILIAGLIVAFGAVCDAPLSIAGAGAAVTLAILVWPPLRSRGRSAALHAQGLVLGRSGARRVVAFEDVNEVWFEIPVLHSRAGAYVTALRLVDYEGEAHRLFLDVNDGATLANSVLHGCSGPLLVEARRALGEGETLTFGKIQLDRTGITVGGARMAWSEIRLAVMSHGRVHLYRRLPILAWRTVRLDRIPNPAVFGGLIAQCVGRVRIDDLLIAPLASEGQSLRAQAIEGGNESALRAMLVGGLSCAAGATITWFTYSMDNHAYIIAIGPILFGAFRFFQGLAALRFDPPR